jgi:hypothetical protein
VIDHSVRKFRLLFGAEATTTIKKLLNKLAGVVITTKQSKEYASQMFSTIEVEVKSPHMCFLDILGLAFLDSGAFGYDFARRIICIPS